MGFINRIGSILVGAILYPFRGLDPLWGLTALSLLTGILFLMIFKWTSNQGAIFEAKQRVKAHLLELRLFADDMVLTFRAQWDLLRANLGYLRHTFRPMLILLIPVILLLVQLDVRFGSRPLAVGESTLLRVKLSPVAPAGTEPRLILPDGLTLDSPPLRIPSEREVDWRLRASAPGDHQIRVQVDGREVTKRLRVEGPLAPMSAEIRQPSLFATLGNPAEPPLPADSLIQSIALEYPARDLRVFGWNVHWLVFFLIVSILPAYAVKGLFGVEV
jgi:hypothetical protein